MDSDVLAGILLDCVEVQLMTGHLTQDAFNQLRRADDVPEVFKLMLYTDEIDGEYFIPSGD